jgi:hypothetical protein
MRKAILIIVVSIVFGHTVVALGQDGWRRAETEHTVILYQNDKDLEVLDGRIDVPISQAPSECCREEAGVFAGLKRKIDQIFRNNQALLQMHGKIAKIAIFVYGTQREIKHAYDDIVSTYDVSPGCYNEHIVGFYFHPKKSVYVSLDTVTEGIIAHELGHAIIDHYFIVRPPTNTAEILARYLDEHLWRE